MGFIKTLARIVERRGNTRQSDTKGKRHYEEKSYPASLEIMRPKLGFRDDVGIEFRSKMEANVYRFYKYLELTHGKIKVRYEPRLFTFPLDSDNRFGIRGYVPDLEVISDSGVWYIEVKGSLSDKDREKFRLLSTHYPRVKLFVIFPEQYNLIRKNYASLISGWEW